MATTLKSDATAHAEALARAYQDAVLAERHLLAELFVQGRPPGEAPPIEALDLASKRRRRAFLAMVEVRLVADRDEDRERVSLVIRDAMERTRAGRIEAAETEREAARC